MDTQSALAAVVKLGGETMGHFSAGEVVTFIPDLFVRHAAPGAYRIVARMPDRDGDQIYRIKSPLEEHERVVTESALAKSRRGVALAKLRSQTPVL
jgi:hypothetical protein